MKKFILGFIVLGAANVAMAATSTTSVSAADVAPVATSVSTSAAAAAAPAAQSKWKQTVFYEHSTSAAAAHRGAIDAGSTAQAAFDVTKDIGGGQGISLRAVFLRNAGEEALTFFDPYIHYSNSKFFGSTVRTNIPMGEWSRAIGRHELRYDMGGDLAKFGKYTLGFYNTSRVYTYSKNSDGQRSFRTQPGLTLAYTVNDKVEPYIDLSHEASWYNSGIGVTAEDLAKNKAATKNPNDRFANILEVGAVFTPVKDFTIRTAVGQEYANGSGSFEFGNDDEVSYTIEFVSVM